MIDPLVFHNGNVTRKSAVAISPDDRAFLFGDAVYEVLRNYSGRLFEAAAHAERLAWGLSELRIQGVDARELIDTSRQLLQANSLQAAPATVYIQVSRGAAPRAHRFPDPPIPPTMYIEAKPLLLKPHLQEAGVHAVLVADQRWARCDIKTVGLLPNVLAQQLASEQGAFEALLVRDGAVLEGSHTNVFFVREGVLRTAPLNNYILDGITRRVVLELAGELGIPVDLRPCFEQDLPGVDEVFLTGTTVELLPVVRIDDRLVKDGAPGPITRRLQGEFGALLDQV